MHWFYQLSICIRNSIRIRRFSIDPKNFSLKMFKHKTHFERNESKIKWNSIGYKYKATNENCSKGNERKKATTLDCSLFNKLGARLQFPLLMIGIKSISIAFLRSLFLARSAALVSSILQCNSHTSTRTLHAINSIGIKCAKFLCNATVATFRRADLLLK